MNEQEEIKYHNQLWYYKTYNQLIDKCIQMESDGYPEDMYTEVHHILPKCMGGTNDKFNLVRMPVRYHIVAHMLLACIYINDIKLQWAVSKMISGDKKNYSSTRVVAWIRGNQSRLFSGKNNPNYGKTPSEETRKKISKSLTGVKHSEERRHQKSIYQTGRKRKPVSEEGKLHMKQAQLNLYKNGYVNPNLGRKLTDEQKELARKNASKPVIQLDINNNFIKEFDSVLSVKEDGFGVNAVINCCKGRRESYKGFIWKYKLNYENEKK